MQWRWTKTTAPYQPGAILRLHLLSQFRKQTIIPSHSSDSRLSQLLSRLVVSVRCGHKIYMGIFRFG
jgi:hypothetical protein